MLTIRDKEGQENETVTFTLSTQCVRRIYAWLFSPQQADFVFVDFRRQNEKQLAKMEDIIFNFMITLQRIKNEIS